MQSRNENQVHVNSPSNSAAAISGSTDDPVAALRTHSNALPSAPDFSLSSSSSSSSSNNSHRKIDIKSDDVTYLAADFPSFETIVPSAWCHQPDTLLSFNEWALSQPNNDAAWIRRPNANSDNELLHSINHRVHEEGLSRNIKVGLNAFFTGISTLFIAPIRSTKNIKPGELHFSNNAGVQEIHLSQGFNYLSGLRHSWSEKFNANQDYIKKDNVTIARVLPGKIGLAFERGTALVLVSGRHGYNSAYFDLPQNKISENANATLIKHGTLTVARILPNELGLAKENGTPMILLPGLHIKNSAAFEFTDRVNTRTLDGAKEHETITIIRVNKNQIGCAMQDGEPVLLSPGVHIKNSRAFKFEKMVDANDPHIHFNTLHVIQVKSDEIGLAWNDNQAITLNPGVYKVNSNTFKFKEFKKVSEKIINHAPITIVRVDEGELGYAWNHGKAVELLPRIHRQEDPQFIFDRHEQANKEVIKHGNIAHVIVKAGEARAVYDKGELKILTAGKHDYLDAQTLYISPNPIPLRDVIKPLKEIKVVTKDRMPMHVTGQVTYRVSDPAKLVNGIGQDKLETSIEQITDATLRHEISKTDLSMISPDHHSQQPEQKEEHHKDIRLLGDKSKGFGEGDTTYRGKLCSAVQETIKETTAMWGIEIVEFAISDIGYQDPAVEKKLADATAKIREAEANFDLQRTQNAVNYEQAKGLAAQKLIEQENLQAVRNIEATTKSTMLTTEATAQAQAEFVKVEQKAKATAAAQRIQAELLKFQAESQRDADIAKAQGQTSLANAEATSQTAVLKAKNEAQSILLNNPNYVKLEEMRLLGEAAKPFANLQSPAVLINGNGNSDTANSMFLGQANFFQMLMGRKAGLFNRPPRHPEERMLEADHAEASTAQISVKQP